jgi:hypothetical protein
MRRTISWTTGDTSRASAAVNSSSRVGGYALLTPM